MPRFLVKWELGPSAFYDSNTLILAHVLQKCPLLGGLILINQNNVALIEMAPDPVDQAHH